MATFYWGKKGRRSIRQAYKLMICEICGDLGYQEAILTCHHCKDVNVHRYCVLGYLVPAPLNWCCEKCDKGKGVISSLHGPENEYSEGSIKISQGTLPLKKRMSYLGWDYINRERRVPNKKMKSISCSGPDGPTLKSLDAMEESGMMDPFMTHSCDPALDHSWEGSFDILGAQEIVPMMLNNCIQAHPPSKVRRIVYEYSHLLPATLKFEFIPRGNIWEGIFNNHSPGKEDIGLYFFPKKKERSEIYTTLVEYMHKEDLVMRTLINDVELLILASTTLRSDSQRWNNKHFLWRLFYRDKTQMGVLEGAAT